MIKQIQEHLRAQLKPSVGVLYVRRSAQRPGPPLSTKWSIMSSVKPHTLHFTHTDIVVAPIIEASGFSVQCA
jgi:hypothetical protein